MTVWLFIIFVTQNSNHVSLILILSCNFQFNYVNYLLVKLTYHPEIDGLRAIAVFSVIINHAQDTFLPGGFLGVDIFFVISGYLITSLILKELKLTNKFSFSHFYERRVRRIMPALLAVVILSNFISYIVLLPDSFIN